MLVAEVSYWYEGDCPKTGVRLRLPRTHLVESIARELMQDLAQDEPFSREGKMYGVLLVETATGDRQVLKAFSGLLNGKSFVEGWVPSIEGRNQIALAEARTLEQLEKIKQKIIQLHTIPERQQYQHHSQEFEQKLQALSEIHYQRKQERQQKRQQTNDQEIIVTLDKQSQKDGIERRRLKQQRDDILKPLKQIIEQADLEIQALKRHRKVLSQQLQAQMNTVYHLTNFAGESRSLDQLLSTLPTGTGECCAPKLLHYAATQGLKPLAMAEFWWGASSANGDRMAGEFYGACVDRCQPIMGFLLSGLSQVSVDPVPILYQDDWIIVVNKPAGLLSVPGRHHHTQDSVLRRLQLEQTIWAVHRLDQDTSGLMVFARDRETYRQLSAQFQQRQVHKIYEAVLSGTISETQGVIDLPLWSDPNDRPYQKVDWQQGKPSRTHFQTLATTSNTTRIEFVPVTGRTHQLRVHAAIGLGAPILGDRLYGNFADVDRLHLHARQLQFTHPHLGRLVSWQTETPF